MKPLLLLLVLSLSQCLKLHHTASTQQTVAALKAQQQNLQSAISSLKERVDKLVGSTNEGDPEELTPLLQEQVLLQKNTLTDLEASHFPQFLCNRTNYSQQQIDESNEKIQATLSNLTTVKGLIAQLPEDIRKKDQLQNVDSIQTYVKKIQEIIVSRDNCKNVVSSNTNDTAMALYLTNMKAPNKNLGSLNPDDITADAFQKIQENQNVATCPQETPFFNNVDCIQCQNPTPIFNLETNECQPCPEPKQFNQFSQKCGTPNGTNVNSAGDNIITPPGENSTQVLAPNPNQTPCPQQKPFFDGTSCINCEDPTPLFDFSTKQCTSCPEGQVLNTQTHQCQAKGPKSNPVGKDNIIAANGTDLDKQLTAQEGDQVCPQDKPYSDGTQCIECVDPTPLFDFAKSQCATCPEGQTFDSQTHQCQSQGPITNPVGKDNIIAPEGTDLDKQLTAQEGDQVCPQDKPYSDGTQCISCQVPTPLFDFGTNQCATCPGGQLFNSQTNQCQWQGPITNPVGKENIIAANGTDLDKQLTAQEGDQVCPQDKPYSDGTQCIECVDPTPLFDFAKSQCATCPEGQTFDSQTHQCKGKTPISNPSGKDNIVAPQGTDLDSLLTAKEGEQVCPEDKPYSNGTECIECVDPTPLFDFSTSQCTSCPEGQALNAQTHQCQPKGPVTNPVGKDSIVAPEGTNLDQELATKEGDQVCPEDKPYSDGTQCIECVDPTPLFDFEAKECTQCLNGQQFNPATNLCQDKFATNKASAENRVILPKDSDPEELLAPGDKQQCDTATPFYNGEECIQCVDPTPLFDFEAKQCSNCPEGSDYLPEQHICKVHTCPEGQYLDKWSQKCISDHPGYLTSLQSPNLIYGGLLRSEIQSDHEATKAQNPEIQDCPSQTPYYDGNQCIECTDPIYFHMIELICKDCPTDYVYNGTKHQCQYTKETVVQPSLQKQAGSVFVGHQ